LEHLEHFGLARDPFRNEVQLEFWFASREHVDVGRRLRRCVEQGKELCVLVGEVGSGTTTVARALIEQLDPDRFEAGLLVPSRRRRRAALGDRANSAWIARAGRSEALRQLHGHLVALRSADRRAVIAMTRHRRCDPMRSPGASSRTRHDVRGCSVVLVGRRSSE
jgi:type II secretory pathway predicted ATPase ExeA